MKIQIVVKIHLHEKEKTMKIPFKEHAYMEKLFNRICENEKVPLTNVIFTYKNGRVSKYDTPTILKMQESHEPIYLHWRFKLPTFTNSPEEKTICPIKRNCVGTKEDQTLLINMNFETFTHRRDDIVQIYVRKDSLLENLMVRLQILRKDDGYDYRFRNEDMGVLQQFGKKIKDLEIEHGGTIFVLAAQSGC